MDHGREFFRSSGLDTAARLGAFPELKLTVPCSPSLRSGGGGIWDLLEQRRSRRSFSERPLDSDVLGQLLWAQNGQVGKLRTAPSAGARFPLDTLVLPFRVQGVDPGCYRYEPSSHTLSGVSRGQTADDFATACLGQEVCRCCALALVWVAWPERAVSRYGERAYRYLLLDAGHIGQNVHLAAESLGLATCMIGAFDDAALSTLVSAGEPRSFPVYGAAVGWPD